MAKHTWSYSALKVFTTCPFRYHAEKVEKLYPFTGNEHTRYGHEVHEAAEYYVGDNVPLHDGYLKFKPGLDALKNAPGEKICEMKMALTEDKQPCAFDDENRWVRGIADLVILSDDGESAKVVDYKTGGAKYPDRDQLELMALMLFAHYPKLKKVKALLWFMTKDVIVKATYFKTGEKNLWKNWEKKTDDLEECFETGKWPKKTNGLCRAWCPVDHCQYNGRK